MEVKGFLLGAVAASIAWCWLTAMSAGAALGGFLSTTCLPPMPCWTAFVGGGGTLPAGGGDGGADDSGDELVEAGPGVPLPAPVLVLTGTADDRPRRAMKIKNPFMLFGPANVIEQF